MKYILIFTLLFTLTELNTSTVRGIFVPNEEVVVYSIDDYLLQSTNMIGGTKADSVGNFVIELEIDSLKQIIIATQDVNRKLFIDKNSTLFLNKSKEKDQFKIELIEEKGIDLNTQISNIEQNCIKIGYDLAMNEENYSILLKKLDTLLENHTTYDNEFLNRIGYYVVASVHLNLIIKEGGNDPLKLINNYYKKWYFDKPLDYNNPYFIGTFLMSLNTLCNLKSYKMNKNVNCNPTDVEGINLLADEIHSELYSDLARFFLVYQAIMIEPEKGVKLAKEFIPAIENKRLQEYFKIISQ